MYTISFTIHYNYLRQSYYFTHFTKTETQEIKCVQFTWSILLEPGQEPGLSNSKICGLNYYKLPFYVYSIWWIFFCSVFTGLLFVYFIFLFIQNALWTMTQQFQLKASFSLKPLPLQIIAFVPCSYIVILVAPCQWYIGFTFLHVSFAKLKAKSYSTFYLS